MVNCCNHSKNDKICIRSSDKKSFKLPRKFSRRKCKNPKGFTMRASCAPYKDCKRSSKKSRKQKGGKIILKTAYFAGGCFWGIQELFDKTHGVLETKVGYMGGKAKKPTYKQVCNENTGHAETIKIIYDPQIVSYGYLLQLFNKIRTKNITDNKSQYRSIIFTVSEDQNTESTNFIKNNPDVELLSKQNYPFYPAEDYHQKYKQKQKGGKSNQDKTIRKLPKLRKIDDSHKKHKYHLSDPQSKRILAINEGINYEMKNRGLTKKRAAISKKGRFNILRIYRKNNKKDECRKLTSDMKYIDKKYNLGKTKNICKGGGKHSSKRSKKTKKQFLYNPDDPKKSFDVYIDKNPNDTIPIKYTTLNDVKNTIKKLESLYKNDKYTHKRIWQVGMILYVRLKVLKDKKPNEFKLAERYFKHLGKRSKIKDKDKKKEFVLRRKHTFKI
jgi:methionine-S-sulfoxide reductase